MKDSTFEFIFTTLIFIGAMVGMNKLLDFDKIKNNWKDYRCRPDVMLMADFYGHNSSENMEFCLSNGFSTKATGVLKPLYSFMSIFVSTLMTMLNNLNSLRMTFATLVGSVTQVFSEFGNRFQVLFNRVQQTGIRMKYMMGRIFATMYSVMFMMMSGIKATTNFGNTFLFKFLDTFCFDPDTIVNIEEKGFIPIKEVQIGDRFEKTGDRVTATFQFMSDGQEMVLLPRHLQHILVSTNHYLLYENKWIRAGDHPLAIPTKPWNGGKERPLICLNTEKHSFPIGSYIFRDYDEIEEGDEETSKKILNQLNNKTTDYTFKDYATCCSGDTLIKRKDGTFTPASSLTLDDELSLGKVVGVVKKEWNSICKVKEEGFTPGTAIWDEEKHRWCRASEIATPIFLETPNFFYSFVVSPSATLETSNGTVFRDYVEIHSPESENVYSSLLQTTTE